MIGMLKLAVGLMSMAREAVLPTLWAAVFALVANRLCSTWWWWMAAIQVSIALFIVLAGWTTRAGTGSPAPGSCRTEPC